MGAHRFHGDPAAALLEVCCVWFFFKKRALVLTQIKVLDPAQNNSFLDHYLDVGYDLSKVAQFLNSFTFKLFKNKGSLCMHSKCY